MSSLTGSCHARDIKIVLRREIYSKMLNPVGVSACRIVMGEVFCGVLVAILSIVLRKEIMHSC